MLMHRLFWVLLVNKLLTRKSEKVNSEVTLSISKLVTDKCPCKMVMYIPQDPRADPGWPAECS